MAYRVSSLSASPISLLTPGDSIYRQGDPSGTLYLVKFGCVMLSRVTRAGTRQVSGFFLPGEVFGWEVEEEHRFSAEAAGTTSIQVFGNSQTPPDWRQAQIIPSLALLREQLLVLSRPTAQSRLAAFLGDLLERQHSSRRIYLPMHRLDIADYLGLSPETVSRVFRRFQKMELIATPSIHLVDVLMPDGLAKLHSG